VKPTLLVEVRGLMQLSIVVRTLIEPKKLSINLMENIAMPFQNVQELLKCNSIKMNLQ